MSDFVLANCSDPDEMLHHAAFHLCLHCFAKLPIWRSTVFKELANNSISLGLALFIIEQNALEILQEHAELRDGDQDYSRALAFRRASCVLKSIPFSLSNMNQLRNVLNIGNHSRRIIQVCEFKTVPFSIIKITNWEMYKIFKITAIYRAA